MEPNHNTYAAPSELPQPEQVGNGLTIPDELQAAQPESRGMQPPATPVPSQQPQTQTPISNMGQVQAPLPVGMPMHAPHTPMATPIADDTDLIEKEWVTRAKAIVMHTKDDPHLQNHEMNKVKADYMKKRYNKDLKVNEN